LMKVYHDRLIEDCRNDLEDHTDAQEDRKSGTIDITVTDHDPARAAQMANAYVEELNRLMFEINSAWARQERQYAEQQLFEAKRDLDVATKELSEFASKYSTIDVTEQAKAAVETSAAVQGQLIAAQSDLRGLQQLYTDNHERVQAAKAQVAELQKQLSNVNSAGVQGNSTADQLPSVRKLPLLGVAYMDLYRKVKVRESVFQALTRQYEISRIEEGHRVASAQVMDEAVVPTKKSFPPRSIILAAGTFIAFWSLVGWVLTVYWWETTDQQNQWKVLLGPYVDRIGATPRPKWLRTPFPRFRRKVADPPTNEAVTTSAE
jgi:capsule polysaccharide export protein KpsE/RkpR